jgi:hypothetical protein
MLLLLLLQLLLLLLLLTLARGLGARAARCAAVVKALARTPPRTTWALARAGAGAAATRRDGGVQGPAGKKEKGEDAGVEEAELEEDLVLGRAFSPACEVTATPLPADQTGARSIGCAMTI